MHVCVCMFIFIHIISLLGLPQTDLNRDFISALVGVVQCTELL